MARDGFRVLAVLAAAMLLAAAPAAAQTSAFRSALVGEPPHIDPQLAKRSIYGGLIASGWHTVGLWMRLCVDAVIGDAASMGSPGLDRIRWTRPVRPGDTLRGRFTVLECIPSRSKPDRGVLRSRAELFNQDGELVMEFEGLNILERRPAPDGCCRERREASAPWMIPHSGR